ncbi:MAG: diacylglycerol kinase family protein [Clostridia bacterium]|nr:diacylglycerol kinase family protein [Clostridia bacterium]
MIRMFKRIFRSFGYAAKGIVRTVCQERNFRIHLVAVCLVSLFAFLYGATTQQWIVLVLLYALVLSLELLNTAVEKTVDLVSPDKHPLAEKAKDAAAGSVLVSAVASVVVAVLMFRDPLKWASVWSKVSTPLGLVFLVTFLISALLFVWGGKRK